MNRRNDRTLTPSHPYGEGLLQGTLAINISSNIVQMGTSNGQVTSEAWTWGGVLFVSYYLTWPTKPITLHLNLVQGFFRMRLRLSQPILAGVAAVAELDMTFKIGECLCVHFSSNMV